MNRHLQFAFVTFLTTAVVGTAAIVLIVVENQSDALMYAITSAMK